MRLTKAEKAAAAAVAGMTVAVIGAGVKLLKRYAGYMAMKAAAHFSEEDTGEEPSGAAPGTPREETTGAASGNPEKPSEMI